MSVNADIRMNVSDLSKDPSKIRENFAKLQRLFKGTFFYESGELTLTVSHLATAAMAATLLYQRVGGIVVLQLTALLSTATKAGVTNVGTTTVLPALLRPAAALYLPYPIMNNGVAGIGALAIATSGDAEWAPMNGGWTNAAAAAIYPASVMYLGA